MLNVECGMWTVIEVNFTMSFTRRKFLALSAQTGFAAYASRVFADEKPKDAKSAPRGKAEHCIFIWLGGGAAQIDMWDPKRLGDPKKRITGSAYEAIPTAVKDVQITKHLSRCAKI